MASSKSEFEFTFFFALKFIGGIFPFSLSEVHIVIVKITKGEITMEQIYEIRDAESPRKWIKVSKSWVNWVNGLLRTKTVENEEILAISLKKGRVFKLYVNTLDSSPVMKGELWDGGKIIGKSIRTAASLLTEWDFESEEEQDVFSIDILVSTVNVEHKIKFSQKGQEPCFSILITPGGISKSFIKAVLKKVIQETKDDSLIKNAENILGKMCQAYGWTYLISEPEISVEL